MRTALADRIYYGWVVAIACFTACGVLFGLTYSFSVFFDSLSASFPVSPARISLVFGIQSATIYVGGAFLGGVLDWLGPRRVLAAGTVLLGGGMLAASAADSYLLFVVTYGLVVGLGMSCCYLVAYAVLPLWFGERRGTATGFASAGLGAGLLVIAPASVELIEAVGWRGAYQVLGLGLGAVLALATLVLADSPESVGADLTREFPDGQPTTDGGFDVSAVSQTVTSLPFLLVIAGWAAIYATLYVLMNHVVPFARIEGIAWAGVTAISVIGVTTSAARLAVGAASDRVGRVSLFVACSASMGVAMLALPYVPGAWGLLLVAVGFGVAYGGNGALLSPLVADLFGSARLGTLYGIASVAFAISGLLAPPLATLGLERFGSYTPVFLGVGVVGVVGAACIAGAAALSE
ncbi:MFS transporter [Natronomonas sp. EA1]|uniref:MFS transporter n=1 Tax=Natronomonas sp. EA1 TaxID=3421655 RepID=UPI003EBF1A9C